ncbi:MAG: nodulation protein NfeD [Pseudohongiellaceae bacterium]
MDMSNNAHLPDLFSTLRWPMLLILLAGLQLAFTARAGAAEVHLVNLNDAIGPASADYLISSLDDAAQANAELVVVRLNTPGGLDMAMRDIISAILASPVPVATWVAPSGARAASAGTYILYASHFAAMAPATNVGSSTPVNLGGGGPLPLPSGNEPETEQETTPESEAEAGASESEQSSRQSGSAMERKVINDAVAYIRGLAELRGRNEEWAERTVVEAANLTASAALEQNVIGYIATDISDLLQQLQGQTTQIGSQTRSLDLEAAEIITIEPDWRYDFLSTITNPNVAYILLMIGFYGLILEFYNPGMGVPGVTGIICLLLGAYALQMLPINYAGLALIIVGVGLMLVEAFSPSFGVFGLGGAVAFVLGSVILMDTDLEAFRISIGIIAAFAVTSAGLFILSINMLMRARKQKVVTGSESMIGSTALALESFESQGHVRAFSENWKAQSDQPVEKGSNLEIIDIDGLILKVKKQE